MSPAAALKISPEVEREIAALKAMDVPRPVGDVVVDLKNARAKNNIKRDVKALENLLDQASGSLLSFRHMLRQTLEKIESGWTRAELATYRGAFVEAIQRVEETFDKSRLTFDQAKSAYNGQIEKASEISDAHSRRFIRNIARELIRLIENRIRQQNRFLAFMKSGILSVLDQRIIELNKDMSLEDCIADVSARYPTVIEYLAR